MNSSPSTRPEHSAPWGSPSLLESAICRPRSSPWRAGALVSRGMLLASGTQRGQDTRGLWTHVR